MMKNNVILLGCDVSMFAMRARIALAEKNVDYEYREEDLTNKSPLLLNTDPFHEKIHVLIHEGKSICESLIIVEYIDESWPSRGPSQRLMPTDPHERAMARFWADFIDKEVHNAGKMILLKKGDGRESAKKALVEALKLLEIKLGDKAFFGGENFGFLDVALITYFSWFEAYEACGDFRVENYCPTMVEWGKRCMERESVKIKKSLADPKKVCEFVKAMKKKVYGID